MISKNVGRLALIGMISVISAVGTINANAQEGEKACADCPVHKKVVDLLSQWEGANAQSASMKSEAVEAMMTKVGKLKQQCPVGSRLSETVGSVQNALQMAVTMSDACSANCPLDDPSNAISDSARASGKELKEARSMALKCLNQLASNVANAVGGPSAACADCADAQAGACEACEGGSISCPIRLASRLGGLKASWLVAHKEVSQLPSETKKHILDGFASIGKESKSVSLVGPSLMALSEGFDVLQILQEKMGEWAAANPDVMASLPASAHQSFMIQAALLDEARDVIQGANTGMKMMHDAKLTSMTSGK